MTSKTDKLELARGCIEGLGNDKNPATDNEACLGRH